MSAPHFSGVWNIGPSIALSTTTGGLCPWDFRQLVGDSCTCGEINQTVGRIGGRLDQDQPHPDSRARCLRRLAHIAGIDAVCKAECGDRKRSHLLLEQRFGAAIERPTVQYGVARPEKGDSVVEIAAMPLAKTAERSA
jgi:hypothetical protein